MEDKYDHKFTDNIRAVFSRYEVPYEIGAWERFVHKRKRKQRWIIWYRIGGIAASLSLIILSIWMRKEVKTGSTEEVIVMHKKVEEDSLQHVTDHMTATDSVRSAKTIPSETFENRLTKRALPHEASDDIRSASTPDIMADFTEDDLRMDAPMDKIFPLGFSMILPYLPDPRNIKNEKYTIHTWDEEVLNIQQDLDKSAAETNKKPVIFGITVSSLMTSAPQASSSQLGMGGGVTTEIPFHNKLALYTGLYISDQTLHSEVNETPTVISGSKALQSVTTDLLSLDIPVNIKYTLAERKDNAFYVAAGISSLAYLEETNASEFLVPHTITIQREAENGEIIEVYETVQQQETIVHQSLAFEQFDVAGQLNLSFGYVYKLGQQRHLVIEPYYKHPLGKLTSRGLPFSTAGVHLRFSFGVKSNHTKE